MRRFDPEDMEALCIFAVGLLGMTTIHLLVLEILP